MAEAALEYLPAFQGRQMTRNTLILQYFNLGMKYAEIVAFLSAYHGITLSVRQLKRVLKHLNRSRRISKSSLDEVIESIEEELSDSGASIGYRQMHQRLVNDHRLTIDRETVRCALKVIDPEGVNRRLSRKLKRRQYRVRGPNDTWHIDGYDKLKPFGFCVHGAIDGYSRRILWLEVASTNNDPAVIAYYYTNYLRKYGGTARKIRGDCGTENMYLAGMQRFFRRNDNDSFAGMKSFLYGKSTSNQRIECWWAFLRNSCTDWWIKYFRDLRDEGLYDANDQIQVECLKFCFTHVIRCDLQRLARHWNTHKIRPVRNTESPSGKPDVLFFLPQMSGTVDYQCIVDPDDLGIAEECVKEPQLNGSPEIVELASMIMEDRDLSYPESVIEARLLYEELLLAISDAPQIT